MAARGTSYYDLYFIVLLHRFQFNSRVLHRSSHTLTIWNHFFFREAQAEGEREDD